MNSLSPSGMTQPMGRNETVRESVHEMSAKRKNNNFGMGGQVMEERKTDQQIRSPNGN
jgi:hypothetical protein